MTFTRAFRSALAGGFFAATVIRAADAPETIAAFQERAAKFNAILTVPTFERTPAEIEKSVADTLGTADAALDKIG